MIFLRLILFPLALCLVAGVKAVAADVTVFAAASLSDALGEVARHYEASSGDRLRFNFGASSTLARQIREGAPADVFFSADEAKMDELAGHGLVATDTRRTLLSNRLVLVVPVAGRAPVSTPEDLRSPAVRRIALAEPTTVPAGIYAREYLERIGLWEVVRPKVVSTANVRAALAAIEAGNVDAGFVYKTDAATSRGVRIAHEVPSDEGPRIAYPVAVLRAAREGEAARRFVAYLAAPEAWAVFARHGFLEAP